MITFFHHKGVFYHHAVPSKTIVNSEYYALIWKIFPQNIPRKHHELVGNRPLHHDEIRPFVSTFALQNLNK